MENKDINSYASKAEERRAMQPGQAGNEKNGGLAQSVVGQRTDRSLMRATLLSGIISALVVKHGLNGLHKTDGSVNAEQLKRINNVLDALEGIC